jgi:hypothetical protein
MVSQCPQVDSMGLGTLGQCFGRQGTVGYDGVAVEVGIKNRGHVWILGAIGAG